MLFVVSISLRLRSLFLICVATTTAMLRVAIIVSRQHTLRLDAQYLAF